MSKKKSKLSQITPGFVMDRAVALEALHAGRNTRMQEYEAVYLGDLWLEAAEPDERRVSAMQAFDVVESYRTLLLTRPPVISVVPSKIKERDETVADNIEKYLYGAWYQAHVLNALGLSEWHASCLGEGVLRVIYDAEACEEDFPLLVQAVDPRVIYASPSGRPGIDSEVVHSWERPRREIEAEWGVMLSRPDDLKSLEEWLDEEVEFIDYWCVDVETTMEVPVPKEVDEPQGAFTSLIRAANEVLEAGIPEEVTERATTASDLALSTEPPPEAKEVRRRVVINCVVVDNQFLKEPVKMPGYHRLPYIRYSGISTPLAGKDASLSVLFPITGGTRQNGAMGLTAAFNQLLAMKQQIIESYSNGAIITDDPTLEIDLSPGSVNTIQSDSEWSYLTPPGPSPAVDRQMAVLEKLIRDSTINVSIGEPGNLSGLALSAMASPTLMKIANRQRVREEAYQTLNEMILALTEEYAGSEGWSVYGLGKAGSEFEATLSPSEIGGYYRNRVKLAANLPKDESGRIMMLAGLQSKGLISRTTFLEQLQEMSNMTCQSPHDELKKVLRDQMLFSGDTAEKLAKLVLADYSRELADELLESAAEIQGPPPGPTGPPGVPAPPMSMPGGPMAGPPPAGPMPGIPPGVVPPQAVPEIVGEGGPGADPMEALKRMAQMQGGQA